ncbi:hypothetical protein M9H77_11021 [Catharanthus roseus]|uniref:Uncharacterized protein n=1 Tax=Catharanthus roseus TaxID=4058 RepID=A0ACC0BDE0_CATRO|nr:hypothetical protein M9H77_11021 [Catharanthus roseus]
MTAELADCVNGKGNVRPNVRESIIKEFCESPASGVTGIPAEHATEASRVREGEQFVLDRSDNMTVRNLEEIVIQGDEGLIGDQLGLDRPEAQSAITRGSGGSMNGLGPGVSGGDQVLDVVLPTGMDVVHPAKTFGTVVRPG